MLLPSLMPIRPVIHRFVHVAWLSLLILATSTTAVAAAVAQADPSSGQDSAAGPTPAAGQVEARSVLAEVGGSTITAGQFAEEMARRGGGLPGQYASAEAREELLDELIRDEALVRRALDAGYDRHPDVKRVFRRILVARFLQDRLDERLERVSVSDEDVLALYREQRQDYALPDRSLVAIVQIRVAAEADGDRLAAARARAASALAEARELDGSVPHFGALAIRYSDDRASRYRGGVVGWLSDDGRGYAWDPLVVEAALALDQPGQIAPLVRTDDGIYLVRLVEREAGRERPFEVVAPGLRNQLLSARRAEVRQAFYREVLAGLPVHVDHDLLAAMEAPQETTPQPLPPG